MSNQSEEEGSKATFSGHLQDQDGAETAISGNEDDHMDMDGNAHQIFGMVELVSNILSHLPISDLKSCNGVSSLWRQEARKLLLKRTRMDFGGGGQDLRAQVDSYVKEMGDNCHQTLGIHTLTDNNETEMIDNQIEIYKLGNKYGYKIQKLYLTMGNPGILRYYTNLTTLSVTLDLDKFINIPQDLIMPSVKTLSIKVKQFQTLLGPRAWLQHHQSRFSLQETTAFAQSLLRMCPMMEYLNLDAAAQIPFLDLFETSEPDRLTIPSQLSGLGLVDMPLGLDLPSTRLLNSLAALQLTMLKIEFDEMDDILGQPPPSLPSLQEILAAFAPTLKHFKLYRIPHLPIGMTATTVTFPEMPKLQTLEITHISAPLLKFIFRDGAAHGIDYMLQFPVLKKFQIKSVDGDESLVDGSLQLCEMFFPEGTLSCPTLTRIDVDCISGIKHGDNCEKEGYCICIKEGPVWNMLKRLITMFPNVEEFKKCGGWQW